MQEIDQFLKSVNKKKMMVIFPHPDDESVMTGGLIQRARSLGWSVHLICLTRGERGQNHLKKSKSKLEEIRWLEFQAAVGVVGFEKMEMWSYPDGGLKDGRDWVRRVKRVIEREKPGVVVSYDQSGITGHPDHIVVGVEICELLKKEMPEVKLVWPSFPGVERKFLVNKKTRDLMKQPELKLNLNSVESKKKCCAIKEHRSQMGNMSFWQQWLMWWFICRREYYAVADFSRDYDYRFVEFKI